MEVPWASCTQVLLNVLVLLVASSKGLIRCDCNTAECRDAGKTICTATKLCYTELYQNTLNRGCDPTPLACENRKPAGVEVDWPAVYCCHQKDLCNKYAIPAVTTPDKEDETFPPEQYEPELTGFNCSNPANLRKSPIAKIINPIYIAVPIAGVCVLLALIIFAMYLLRRRTDYHNHDSLHHYHHEHATTLSQKQVAVVPHQCQCMCKKQTAPSSSKGNRCTDSERSSSGSETKLFLQS